MKLSIHMCGFMTTFRFHSICNDIISILIVVIVIAVFFLVCFFSVFFVYLFASLLESDVMLFYTYITYLTVLIGFP